LRAENTRGNDLIRLLRRRKAAQTKARQTSEYKNPHAP